MAKLDEIRTEFLSGCCGAVVVDTLERLCLPAGRGMLRDPPGRAVRCDLGEGSLGIPANAVAPHDPTPG